MVSTSRNDAGSNHSKEDELVSTSKVLIIDPQMVQISLDQIKHLLTTATWAQVVMVIGSLLFGGVVSALFSNIRVHPLVLIGSMALFVLGIFLNVYLKKTKIRELERKGIEIWQ